MANLIIKSSADNLVLQGSDASPAITVGATGTTTFAEPATMSGTLGVTGNTTLSGSANNLGTVTAGSIAGGSITSATTFPDGHIVQTTGLTSLSNSTTTKYQPVADTFYSTVVNGTITPIYSDSSIIIHSMFVVRHTNVSGHYGYSMRFGKNSASLTASHPAGTSDYISGSSHGSIYRNSLQYIDINTMWHVIFMDENVGIADEVVTYNLEVAGLGLDSSGDVLQVGSTYGGKSHTFCQEVKR